MKYYVIGIGGSGARVIESLTYLSAAGMGPESLEVLLIDSDEANGNLQSTVSRLIEYQDLRSKLPDNWDGDFLRTQISSGGGGGRDAFVWSPLSRLRQAISEKWSVSLESFFGLPSLPAEVSRVARYLYSSRELQEPLTRGFKGRPNLGAPVVFTELQRAFADGELRTMAENLRRESLEEDGARVFIVGSVFGGTGAAGIPVVARALREYVGEQDQHWTSLRIGGALLLPYFKVDTARLRQEIATGNSPDELYAIPDNAPVRTQSALAAYADTKTSDLRSYNDLYMLGDCRTPVAPRARTGGAEQDNPSHHIELIAALAAIDFFEGNSRHESGKDKLPSPKYLQRSSEAMLTWADLPRREELRRSLFGLMASAVGGLTVFKDMATSKVANKSTRKTNGIPWIVDHFEPKELLDWAGSKAVKLTQFWKESLHWLNELHSYPDLEVRLFDGNKIDAFVKAGFSNKDNEAENLIGQCYPSESRLLKQPFDELHEEASTIDRSLDNITDPFVKYGALLATAATALYDRIDELHSDQDVKEPDPNPTPFLPRVGTDFPKAGSTGEWLPRHDLLSLVASEMKTVAHQDKLGLEAMEEALVSIPTPWARPKLYASALFGDESLSLSKAVTDQWRGLLGVFAFSATLFNKCSCRTVAHDMTKGDDQLSRTLRSMAPNEAWQRVTGITINDKLIAVFSPDTGFFMPPEFSGLEAVPWLDKERGLYDPAEYFSERKLTKQLKYLKGWISDVIVDLKKNRRAIESEFARPDQIIGALDTWSKLPCFKNIGDGRAKRSDPLLPGALKYLSKPLPRIRNGGGDFFLSADYDDATPTIAIWEEQWNSPNKIVAAGITSDRVPLPKEKSGKELSHGSIRHDWIKPELFFFTDKIARLVPNLKNVMTESYSQADSDNTEERHNDDWFIPPLHPNILRFFTPEHIASMFEWGKTDEDSAEVILRVPLSSGEIATYRREYSGDGIAFFNDIMDMAAVPLIQVWPDYISDKVSRGFLFNFWSPTSEFNVEPVGKNGPIAGDFRTGANYLQVIQSMPSAIAVKQDSTHVGMLLIRFPKDSRVDESGEHVVHCSLDFGTCVTTVGIKRGSDIRILNFKRRVVDLTSPDVATAGAVSSFTFPAEKNLKAITTLLRKVNPNEPNLNAMIHGVIPHQNIEVMAEDYSSFQRDVVERLKWSLFAEERRWTSVFLDQVLLMIAGEVVQLGARTLYLHWSYPSAFTPALAKELQASLDARLSDIGVSYGLTVQLQEGVTESVAACRYALAHRGAQPGSSIPQVTMDTGGRTSDIAVWLRSELVHQTSIALAGNNISKLIAEDEILFANLMGLVGILPEESDVARGNPSLAVVNALFRDKFAKLSKRIVKAGMDRSGEFARIRGASLFMFNTLFYYLGLVLKSISKDSSQLEAKVFFSGNGSRLLDWNYPDQNDTRLAEHLTQMMACAYGVTPEQARVEIVRPESEKRDVAIGLLCETSNLELSSKPSAVVGESGYRLDGSEIFKNDDMFREINGDTDVLKRVQVPVDFPELKKAIQASDSIAQKMQLLQVSKQASEDIVFSSVRSGIEQAINDGHDDRSNILSANEPFFILAIPHVIQQAFK